MSSSDAYFPFSLPQARENHFCRRDPRQMVTCLLAAYKSLGGREVVSGQALCCCHGIANIVGFVIADSIRVGSRTEQYV